MDESIRVFTLKLEGCKKGDRIELKIGEDSVGAFIIKENDYSVTKKFVLTPCSIINVDNETGKS